MLHYTSEKVVDVFEPRFETAGSRVKVKLALDRNDNVPRPTFPIKSAFDGMEVVLHRHESLENSLECEGQRICWAAPATVSTASNTCLLWAQMSDGRYILLHD
jgi:hypothetical protein